MIEALVADRLAHYGYTSGQITEAMTPLDHDAHGCEFDGNSMRWDCHDDTDTSRHPLHDEAGAAAEWIMWVLEHPAFATHPEALRLGLQALVDGVAPGRRTHLADALQGRVVPISDLRALLATHPEPDGANVVEAKAQALREAADECLASWRQSDPKGIAWLLRDRADRIERGER